MENKCNINFISQYCFINNESIHIDDYIQLYKNNHCEITCTNGHELVLVMKIQKI